MIVTLNAINLDNNPSVLQRNEIKSINAKYKRQFISECQNNLKYSQKKKKNSKSNQKEALFQRNEIHQIKKMS